MSLVRFLSGSYNVTLLINERSFVEPGIPTEPMTPMSCVSYGELIPVPNKPTTDKAYTPTAPLQLQLSERQLPPHTSPTAVSK